MDADRARVPRLDLLCQIKVLYTLQEKAIALESNYFAFLEDELSNSTRLREQETNICGLNTKVIVSNYEAKVKELAMKANKKAQRNALKAGRAALQGTSSGASQQTRYHLRPRRSSTPYDRPPAPPPPPLPTVPSPFLMPLPSGSNSNKRPSVRQRCRAPKGILTDDYIRFRKCKLVEDIDKVRQYLLSTLNKSVINAMMMTIMNISDYSAREESGIFLLQAMLMTPNTTSLLVDSQKLWPCGRFHNAYSLTHQRCKLRASCTEVAILHYSLLQGANLTQLQMKGAAFDSLLVVVGLSCPNLVYIDVSNSPVSDRGLFALCGVEELHVKAEERAKPRLPRNCKRTKNSRSRGSTTALYKVAEGCSKLASVVAENLQSIAWPPMFSDLNIPIMNWHQEGPSSYLQYIEIPETSGFVAMLRFLPNLRVFWTKVSGRAVLSFARFCKKRRGGGRVILPNLEVISESNMSESVMKSLVKVCPSLKHVSATTRDPMLVSDEAWLVTCSKAPAIQDLRIVDFDFRTNALTESLIAGPSGARLTVLDLREMCHFKYSWIMALKLHCVSLKNLVLCITNKNFVTAVSAIEIDKDLGSQELRRQRPGLGQLENFYLSGPFGNDIVKYALKGADKLARLNLNIDWIPVEFCSAQPASRDDILGQGYFNEILSVNKLEHLMELHLSSRYKRGRQFLIKPFADFILSRLPRLRHFGNFRFWSLRRQERDEIINTARLQNRSIVFDEELTRVLNTPSDQSPMPDFLTRYVEDRATFSCQGRHPMSGKLTENPSGILDDIFQVLVGPPDDFNSDSEDSDDSLLDDDEDGLSDDENEIIGHAVGGGCPMM